MKFTNLKSWLLALSTAMVLSFGLTGSADAGMISIGFTRLTSNSVDNVEDQFVATLYDAAMASSEYGLTIGANDVLFTFQNNIGIASKIHEIYFDDSSFDASGEVLSTPVVVRNSLGGFTDYATGGVTPANLPSGGNANPDFIATEVFSAQATGNPNNYINTASDILGIQFATISNGGYDAVEAALISGNLRLGLHVGGIGSDGESDGFISVPPNDPPINPDDVVPEPASLALLGLGGLLAGAGVNRRRKKLTAETE